MRVVSNGYFLSLNEVKMYALYFYFVFFIERIYVSFCSLSCMKFKSRGSVSELHLLNF